MCYLTWIKITDESFWYDEAQTKLQGKLAQTNVEKEAKNTILFLGDGMSIPTVTAARIFKGQVEGLPNGGEEGELHFDKFPHTALSKVNIKNRYQLRRINITALYPYH